MDTFFGVMPSRVNFLQNIYGIAKEKTDLLFMGADDECVEQAALPEVRKAIREKYGIREDDFLVMTGGKIDSFKTQTLLLMEAVKEIEHPRLRLLIFGSVEEDLKERFDALCDGKKIQYMGWAKGEQPYEYFATADLIVFPGRHSVYWEQVVAQGIPMLCKYWDGTTHVDIGGNVHFLKEDSVQVIKTELQGLLDHPDEYEKMKQAALSNRRHEFSYKQIARRSIE